MLSSNGPDLVLTIRHIESKEHPGQARNQAYTLHHLEACQAQGLQPNHFQIHLIFGTSDLSMPTSTSLSHLLHPDYHAVVLHLPSPSVPSFPLAHLFSVSLQLSLVPTG